MEIHHYHPETGELIGSSAARPDPLVPGGWLIPAHATTLAPPAAPQGLAAVWSGAAWTLAEDHRGRRGWLDGQPATVTELGPLPPGWADAAPEPGPGELAAARRAERDARLAACDWTQLPDAPLDDAARAAWAEYRQALRDVPGQPGFPGAVQWPAPPLG
jgi:hypothetical protein